jgi:hypothetical protein
MCKRNTIVSSAPKPERSLPETCNALPHIGVCSLRMLQERCASHGHQSGVLRSFPGRERTSTGIVNRRRVWFRNSFDTSDKLTPSKKSADQHEPSANQRNRLDPVRLRSLIMLEHFKQHNPQIGEDYDIASGKRQYAGLKEALREDQERSSRSRESPHFSVVSIN